MYVYICMCVYLSLSLYIYIYIYTHTNNILWRQLADGQLVGQVQFSTGASDNVCLAEVPKLPGDRAAHHAAVSCNIILCHWVGLSSRVILEVKARSL